jgi:hypothetical protein
MELQKAEATIFDISKSLEAASISWTVTLISQWRDRQHWSFTISKKGIAARYVDEK